MTKATIGRWGSSLAVRFPADVAASFNLHDGERIDIDAQPDQIVIRKALPRHTLQDLFAGRSADEWRALYANAFDWGPDVGREIVED